MMHCKYAQRLCFESGSAQLESWGGIFFEEGSSFEMEEPMQESEAVEDPLEDEEVLL
jgi:hypothetical protein